MLIQWNLPDEVTTVSELPADAALARHRPAGAEIRDRGPAVTHGHLAGLLRIPRMSLAPWRPTAIGRSVNESLTSALRHKYSVNGRFPQGRLRPMPRPEFLVDALLPWPARSLSANPRMRGH
jgi:hypothetical protein